MSAVDHPKHYNSHPSGIECIAVVQHFDFCFGNAIKYLWRAGEKGSELQDLEKSLWYLRCARSLPFERPSLAPRLHETVKRVVQSDTIKFRRDAIEAIYDAYRTFSGENRRHYIDEAIKIISQYMRPVTTP